MTVPRRRSLRNLLRVHEIAFLFLVAVTGLLVGLSTYYWQQTSAESVRINNLIYLAEQIRGELFRQVHQVTRARLLEDLAAMEVYAEDSRTINRHFNHLRQNSAARDEDLAVQRLQEAYREIQKDMNRIFGDPYAVNYVVRMRILDPGFAGQMLGEFEDRYNELKSLLAAKHERLDHTLQHWVRFAPVLIPCFFVAALLLVLSTARIVRRDFVRPMATVKEGAAAISRGDLGHRIPEQGVLEVAQIAESINRMAADLDASRKALVEYEKQVALGALVPVIAHNIRNPLASIRATAQMIGEADDANELRESRVAIIDTIDRLGRWVNALVSYLHPLQPNIRSTAASQLLQAALGILKPKLEEKSIRIERLNWENDAMLDVDPDLMEQAIAGLLANAAEASPPAGTIRIGLEVDDAKLRITIADEGPGLPFEPAAGSLEPGPSTKRFGTGLGIPVAFKICQSHGWDLEFRRGSPIGTEVVITAPRRAAGAGAA